MSAPQFSVRAVAWESPDGEKAARLRFDVFVREQNVPPELELDEYDADAFHVVAEAADGSAVGTGRLIEHPDFPAAGKIGRMAVAAEFRGRGVGRALLAALMNEGRRRGYPRLVLDAQEHAIPFYEKAGFTVFGDPHDDAGIPHRYMQISRETLTRKFQG